MTGVQTCALPISQSGSAVVSVTAQTATGAVGTVVATTSGGGGYRSLLAFWAGGTFGSEFVPPVVIPPVVIPPVTTPSFGGGAGNGKPIVISETYDWRSINELYRDDARKQAESHAAILVADDEAAIAAIMSIVLETEEML